VPHPDIVGPLGGVADAADHVTAINHGVVVLADGAEGEVDGLLFPQKRTFSGTVETSEICQELTHAAQQDQHSYSITSSARASTDCGMVKPSALAVLRLITVSYLVADCTGRSAGFSPLRTRST
jgi:hypothetical protein